MFVASFEAGDHQRAAALFGELGDYVEDENEELRHGALQSLYDRALAIHEAGDAFGALKSVLALLRGIEREDDASLDELECKGRVYECFLLHESGNLDAYLEASAVLMARFLRSKNGGVDSTVGRELLAEDGSMVSGGR